MLACVPIMVCTGGQTMKLVLDVGRHCQTDRRVQAFCCRAEVQKCIHALSKVHLYTLAMLEGHIQAKIMCHDLCLYAGLLRGKMQVWSKAAWIQYTGCMHVLQLEDIQGGPTHCHCKT